MTHEVPGEPDDLEALRAAVEQAVEPQGPLEWGAIHRAVWFGVDLHPDAPVPRDIVDRAAPPGPDEHPVD